jgi:hypothetical protein
LKERELSGHCDNRGSGGLNRDADVLLLEQGVFQEFFLRRSNYFQKAVYPLAHTQMDGVP